MATPRSKAVASLDQWFSKFIRLRDSVEGIATCVTCGVKKPWKEVDAGHFQTRAKYATRWHEKNVHAQCKGCNMVNGGQQYVHGKRIDEMYGEGTADELVILSHQIMKFSTKELQEISAQYKAKVEQLL